MADAIDRQARLAHVASLVELGDAMQAAASRADWDGLGEHTRALSPLLRAPVERISHCVPAHRPSPGGSWS